MVGDGYTQRMVQAFHDASSAPAMLVFVNDIIQVNREEKLQAMLQHVIFMNGHLAVGGLVHIYSIIIIMHMIVYSSLAV